MKTRFPVFLLFTGLVIASSFVSAALAQPRQDLVKAQLVADASTVKPGETFTVGVLLKLEPGWHVYWHNPGDSGRETTVSFDAPAGFKVGKLRYPVPVKFDQPGNAIGYGYEREVLLTAEVKAPADLHGARDVTISADVSWLCCADTCIPGKAKLSLTLPVADKRTPANEQLFAAWSERFPHGKHADVECGEWEMDRDAGAYNTRVHWRGDARPTRVELYPGKDEAIEIEKADVLTSDDETSVTVKAHILPGQTPEAETLPALLVYTDAKGVRRGINLSVPISAGKAK